MVTHIAVCGDSFGVGAGLPDKTSFEDNFSGVVSKYFDLPQRIYARSGCCNMTIFLQVEKIIEQTKSDPAYKPLVLITTTYHERIIFPLDDGFKYRRPDLSDVEYLSYVPYAPETGPDVCRPLEFNTSSNPRLITETISNIEYYQNGKSPGIKQLFLKVNSNKFEAIKKYFLELFDTGIKKTYDDSLFVHMHLLLKYHNIPHVLMGHRHPKVISPENNLEHSWGIYTNQYPDTRGSGHCNEIGNRLVGENIIKHIERYNLI